MNTKEVCRRLSVTPKMLRVYESQKLISAGRSDNGYRDYTLDDLLQVQIVVMLRNLGFSLKEIKTVLNLTKSKNDYLHHFYIQLKAVETKISELNIVKDKLTSMINRILGEEAINEEFFQMINSDYINSSESTTYETMINRWNFDLMAVDYVNRFLKEDSAYLNSIARTSRLLKDMTPGRKIVDVGGGTCYLWQGFPEDTQLTVVDKSMQMIFSAKGNVPWANYILDDILCIDKSMLGKFDLVVSSFTLHHISYDQQEKALKNMISLCSEKGTVLIVDRSFYNQSEKDKAEKDLAAAGNFEFLEIIRSEYYLLTDQITNYIQYLGYEIQTLFFENDIWGVLIEK